MVACKKLYRVVKQQRYNGGAGRDELQNETVLYCGYDRLEAARVYHENNTAPRGGGPGSYYTAVRVQSKDIAEE